MEKDYVAIERAVKELCIPRYDSRVNHFVKEIRILNLPNSVKATELVLSEMTKEKGFQRNDEKDYFVHPVAVAQTALDFKIIRDLIGVGDTHAADVILSACLLHDIVEDVDWITKEIISERFGQEISEVVDNVTKRPDSDGEAYHDYVKRFSSNEYSALVKVLDRVNNISTLSQSSLSHRIKQVKETETVFIPLSETFRREYWQFGSMFWQAKTIMEGFIREVDRDIKNEEEKCALSAKVTKQDILIKELLMENAKLKSDLNK